MTQKLKFEINVAGTEYFIIDDEDDSVGVLLKDEKKTWCSRLNMVFFADQLRQIADKLDELNAPKKGGLSDEEIWKGV